MEYTGKLYGEGGIPLMLTASDVDALESMRSRLCVAMVLPADSTPETVADAVEARRVVVGKEDMSRAFNAGFEFAKDWRNNPSNSEYVREFFALRANQGGDEHGNG